MQTLEKKNQVQLNNKNIINRRFLYSSKVNLSINNNPAHKFALSRTLRVYESNSCYSLIPKNACSTMRFSIAKANGFVNSLQDIHWIHANNQAFMATNETAYLSSYTFTILRCPFSRVLSAFMDKIVNFDIQAWQLRNARQRKFELYDLSFKQFILELDKMNPANFDIHWRPQHHFFLFEKYDGLYALENFDKDIPTIESKTGIEIIDTRDALKHDSMKLKEESGLEQYCLRPALELLVRKREGFKPPQRQMFDEQIIEIIKKIYAEDFRVYQDNFGLSPLMKEFY